MTDPAAPTVPGLTGLSVLARGGYATVYRALQESVAREVAVKIENRTLESERDRRRFLREARAAGRMSSHPHVVDLFDAGVTTGGHPYLIMELCGGSYADRMRTSPLSAVEARDVGMKIADALADAHALGVLHRDVKPANILVTFFGEPALADFGLAVLAEARDASVTLDVLTPAYAPPELFQQGPPSPAVDVYALCATLYTVIRGRPPRWQEGHNPSLVSLMELFRQPIPDLPAVPRAMMDILRAGMANESRDRPTAERLRDLLAALALPPTPTVGGAPAVAAEPWPPQPPPQDTPTVPTKRRWRLMGAVVAGLTALALLIGGITWYAVTRDDRPGGTTPVVLGTGSASPSRTPRACVFAVFSPAARCPTEPECFDALTIAAGAARAARRPCDQTHTWETFALGTLPASVGSVNQATVKAAPAVAGLCNGVTLAALDLDILGWQVDVLPPAPDEFARGDRTFRCLAGKGRDKLTTQTVPIGP